MYLCWQAMNISMMPPTDIIPHSTVNRMRIVSQAGGNWNASSDWRNIQKVLNSKIEIKGHTVTYTCTCTYKKHKELLMYNISIGTSVYTGLWTHSYAFWKTSTKITEQPLLIQSANEGIRVLNYSSPTINSMEYEVGPTGVNSTNERLE